MAKKLFWFPPETAGENPDSKNLSRSALLSSDFQVLPRPLVDAPRVLGLGFPRRLVFQCCQGTFRFRQIRVPETARLAAWAAIGFRGYGICEFRFASGPLRADCLGIAIRRGSGTTAKHTHRDDGHEKDTAPPPRCDGHRGPFTEAPRRGFCATRRPIREERSFEMVRPTPPHPAVATEQVLEALLAEGKDGLERSQR